MKGQPHKKGNCLWVKGLDAFDGTSILDIKIYMPRYDCFPMAEAPLHWCASHGLETTSRTLHWDTMNVGLTLGMRTGLRALKELGVGRGQATSAQVIGGNFFAQGVEGVTGCSVLNETMQFKEKIRPMNEWTVSVSAAGRTVSLLLNDRLYQGADEVLCVKDDILFAQVETA